MSEEVKEGQTHYEGDSCKGGHLPKTKYHATDHEHGPDCEWCVVSAGSDQKYWINELNTAYVKGIVSRDAEVKELRDKLKEAYKLLDDIQETRKYDHEDHCQCEFGTNQLLVRRK